MEGSSFTIGEIAIFESYFRREVYVSRVMQIHIDYFGQGWQPIIKKATNEQKKMWYENDKYELVLDEIEI